MKKESIACPLCGANVPHEEVMHTHVWRCKECPFVGFEYYNDNDVKNVGEALIEYPF